MRTQFSCAKKSKVGWLCQLKVHNHGVDTSWPVNNSSYQPFKGAACPQARCFPSSLVLSVLEYLTVHYSYSSITSISECKISWSAPMLPLPLPLMYAIFLACSSAGWFLVLLKMLPTINQLRSGAQLVTCVERTQPLLK